MAAGQSVTDIVMTDFAGACGIVSSNALHANSKVIDIHFSGSGALRPGNYSLGGSGVDAQFANYDAMCGSPSGESAGGGSVDITSVSPTIQGSFDLYFNADHVTGTFDVPNCSPAPSDGGTSSCRS